MNELQIFRSPVSSDAGQVLVQALIGIAVTGIMIAGFTAMMENQQRESRALAEKISALDLARSISVVLSQASTCNLLFTPGNISPGSSFTFDPATATFPFLINLQAVPQSNLPSGQVNVVSLASQVVSDLSSTLKVQPNTGIQVQVESATTGSLLINFDQSRLVRPIKNLRFPISIATTPSGTNQQIVGCQQSGNTGGSCPTGQLMIGINPDGTPICTTPGSQAGAPCGAMNYPGLTVWGQKSRCCLVGGQGSDAYCIPF
ncbi:MAG: hypothetical protein HC902_04640 [Calothrix sp. SM1_5_4]|nr:hypothetical protein [Calothrix sp. SM1_5_4]